MAEITLEGATIHTTGELPALGEAAPDFVLTGTDLNDITLEDYADSTLILNIFPSLDTDVCAASVRRFNEEASSLDDTTVLCVSADLPFAMKRFCVSNGLENVVNGSSFRSTFGDDYGVKISDGPLKGLNARAVVVVSPRGNVTYVQLVDEITTEPDYDAALQAAVEAAQNS